MTQRTDISVAFLGTGDLGCGLNANMCASKEKVYRSHFALVHHNLLVPIRNDYLEPFHKYFRLAISFVYLLFN